MSNREESRSETEAGRVAVVMAWRWCFEHGCQESADMLMSALDLFHPRLKFEAICIANLAEDRGYSIGVYGVDQALHWAEKFLQLHACMKVEAKR